MIPPPVPAWKKWLMLVFVLGFVVMAVIVWTLKRASRDRDADQARPPSSRPA